MQRRDFLKLTLATSLLAACDRSRKRGRLGLALGGGGARGLAHIPMLEVLDELDIRPQRIAGTSIGAVIGALYASGMSGHDIRQQISRLTVDENEFWLSSLFSEDVGRWFDFFDMQLGKGGLMDTRGFAEYMQELLQVSRFQDLQIPLQIVATDFWEREQVVFDSGDLLPAIQASIAIPGLFNPLHHDGKVLVDGGLVNPVPYDLLFSDCDTVIAIDVLGVRTPTVDNSPSYFETSFNAIQIMQAAIMHEKLKQRAPDIYIKPELTNIRVLEFNRAEEIYQQAATAQQTLRHDLRALL